MNTPNFLQELMKTKIGGFGVEFARSNYDPAVLSICKGRLVMFGCVDPSDTPVPPLASVVERVREAVKYIEPKNLLLAPDCGLMTISRELANAKARLLVEAARELRRTPERCDVATKCMSSRDRSQRTRSRFELVVCHPEHSSEGSRFFEPSWPSSDFVML